jgi:sulfite reductase (NADPH) flavoprotein alpha-component
MLALALAFLVLFVVAWRLLRPAPYVKLQSPSRAQVGTGSGEPSRAQRLLQEAFEFAAAAPGQSDDQQASDDRTNVLVLYATEYGFAREVARKAAALLAACPSLRPRVLNVLNFACVDFGRETAVLLVCSTTGDGVPPNEAEDFCAALRDGSVHTDHRKSPKFGVLALGDRAYPHFCRGGHVLEELLVKAFQTKPTVPRGQVDQEDWECINKWLSSFKEIVFDTPVRRSNSAVAGDAGIHAVHIVNPDQDYLPAAVEKYLETWNCSPSSVRYSRNAPYMASILSRKPLTRSTTMPASGETMLSPPVRDAEPKLVIRVEFDLSDSEMQYRAGDALGVIPKNNPDLVERVTLAVAASGEELVVVGAESSSSITETLKRPPVLFKDALMHQLDLKTIRPELIDAIGVATDMPEERARCAELLGREPGSNSSSPLSQVGKRYVACRDVLDVLSDFVGARLTPAELVRLLRPLTARYYSISSSPIASPDRVAITVDVLQYTSLNIKREGVASTFLNNRVSLQDDKVGIFVSKNDNFRLPEDGAKPIVMIGPGTGIAPFVAFIDERMLSSAAGRNVLYFGCRHSDQDFLYRDKLEDLASCGKIELETAFSRDQSEKIYVQHRLAQRAGDIWSLMENEGAHFYVCGDGRRMARDVEETLGRVVQEQGCMSKEDACAYLERLSKEGRMQRDVWVP